MSATGRGWATWQKAFQGSALQQLTAGVEGWPGGRLTALLHSFLEEERYFGERYF